MPPAEKLAFAQELADLLAEFPQGTVSIVGPGKGYNWHKDLTPITGFDIVSQKYFNKLADSGHPIYDPSELYETMQMNQTKSRIFEHVPFLPEDEGYDATKPDKTWKRNTGQFQYSPDIHFSSCEANYDKLILMVLAAVFTTQFLGNMIDIAATEWKPGHNTRAHPSIHGHVVSDNT